MTTPTLAGTSRRTVLKFGAGGIAVLLGGGAVNLSSATRASAFEVNANLFVHRGTRTMIDGLVVPFLGFGSTRDRLEVPGGLLDVQTGDKVNVTITNLTDVPVGFAVPGAGVASEPVAKGTTRTVSFTAPSRPGTYYYVGTLNGSADTGRALGATGAVVVHARTSPNSLAAAYPGVAGKRQPLFGRLQPAGIPATWAQERVWLFAELNPTTARDLAGGRVALPDDPEPEYFLMNGLSGMLSVEDHQTNITGQAGGLGQPGEATLVRMINTGRAPRSVHVHGNHFWVLSHPTTPWIVGAFKDTVTVPSGRTVDILVPLETPPDSFPVTNRAQKYVIHDHIEMAQTASGGHYPSGMVSELIFE